jgi:hypothetical protein
VENGRWEHKKASKHAGAGEKPGADWKKTCKSVEQEEDYEKGHARAFEEIL